MDTERKTIGLFSDNVLEGAILNGHVVLVRASVEIN